MKMHRWELACFVLSIAVLFATTRPAIAQNASAPQWTQPTDEELKMTAQPEVPGASAVYLNWDEQTDDLLHMKSIYVRVKVLSEAGRGRADVRLNYESYFSNEGMMGEDFTQSVTDLAGRTIHSDGTIIPFTGKPFKRKLEMGKEGDTPYEAEETVFTLPDVQVGSILEYRFKYRIPDEWYMPPRWFIQKDLFVRSAHFSWKASDIFMDYGDAVTLAYSAVLPKGVTVKSSATPGTTGTAHGFHRFELSMQNVPPTPHEPYMPPMQSLTYRVSFYESQYTSQEQFWKENSKLIMHDVEGAIGPPDAMAEVVKGLTTAEDSSTVKLQKFYAAIMQLDNSDYSRQHTEQEDKAHHLRKAKTVHDIWNRKAGNGADMAALFVALARAAGMRAYMMAVTSRDHDLFSAAWLSTRQLDDWIAIVVVDGKEQYFDPGQRYCPFGQLAWKHTGAGGVREVDGGTALGTSPEPPYTQSQLQRVGDLTVDAEGNAQGQLNIKWMGAPALEWRQRALVRDDAAIRHQLKVWVEEHIPEGLKATVISIDNLQDYEKPLAVSYSVRGPLATMTEKRMTLPSQFYEARSSALFPEATRDITIYFDYGERVIDAVRYKYPAGMTLESAPKSDEFMLLKLAAYHSTSNLQTNAVTMRRTYDLGTVFFAPAEYKEVREFYNKMAADDQEPLVLMKAGTATTPASGATSDKSN